MSMPSASTQLALMIGLGVGIDYALFIVTRFRENYLACGDMQRSLIEAMDTSGRAILLAGSTVIVALLGMFATGVSFLYGLAIASVIAVLLTLAASLTLLPALLSRFGARLVRPRGARLVRPRGARRAWINPRRAGGSGARASVAPGRSAWRRWSQTVQSRPWPLAIIAMVVMSAAHPRLRTAAGQRRRRERPGERQLAPRLRPACTGVRSRFQRATAMKNMLEWTIGDAGTYGKPVAWINAAGRAAPTGAADAHDSLAKVLRYAGADVVQDACARIPVGRDVIDEQGEISDEQSRAQIAATLERLAATRSGRAFPKRERQAERPARPGRASRATASAALDDPAERAEFVPIVGKIQHAPASDSVRPRDLRLRTLAVVATPDRNVQGFARAERRADRGPDRAARI